LLVNDYEGPTTADASLQVQTIKQLIAKHVDAIAVAPDDPAVVAPALQQAEAQGIKTFTSDTDAPGTVRRVFVNTPRCTSLPLYIPGRTLPKLSQTVRI
jgi:rhamnose transport system substrate-binding protein